MIKLVVFDWNGVLVAGRNAVIDAGKSYFMFCRHAAMQPSGGGKHGLIL